MYVWGLCNFLCCNFLAIGGRKKKRWMKTVWGRWFIHIVCVSPFKLSFFLKLVLDSFIHIWLILITKRQFHGIFWVCLFSIFSKIRYSPLLPLLQYYCVNIFIDKVFIFSLELLIFHVFKTLYLNIWVKETFVWMRNFLLDLGIDNDRNRFST